MTDTFELRRQSDDLVYTFTRTGRADGLPGFRRDDRDLWIVFRPRLGWVSWDEDSGSVTGRPWEVLPEDQSSDAPPEGVWISRKGSKSYVYRLVHVEA